MAYNVLKGNVEGSFDQHADQEISGVKIFKNVVSASVFYDTTVQSACATIKELPIQEIKGRTPKGILIYKGDQIAETNSTFRYVGDTLHVGAIVGKLEGDGSGIRKLPNNQFSSPIPAASISYGLGFTDIRGRLQVKPAPGLICDDAGVGISLSANSGLSFRSQRLTIDPTACDSITKNGQNLSDKDSILVYDESVGQMRHSSLKNLYDKYINEKTARPAGINNSIQMKGGKGFVSSDRLTYDMRHSTLNVKGIVEADHLKSYRKAEFKGAVTYNVVKISGTSYAVKEDDYTILLDSGNKTMKVTLPPAINNMGRILIFKKVNSNKYKLNSGVVKLVTEEGTIDITQEVVFKMNYACRTLQSDGENWWIIGSKGS